MITPVCVGGLGNMLYQIAKAIALAKRDDSKYQINILDWRSEGYRFLPNKTINRDMMDYGGHPLPFFQDRPYSLFDIFPLLDRHHPALTCQDLMSQCTHVYVCPDIADLHPSDFIREQVFGEVPPIGVGERVVIHGFFFSHLHYSDALPEVRQALTPATEIVQYTQKFFAQLPKGKRTIGIHLRLNYGTDTFDQHGRSVLGGEWYERALKQIPGWKEAYILVVSSDPSKAKEILKGVTCTFVEGKPMFVDLFLLAACDDLVLSPSTFSMWAAILNPKVVGGTGKAVVSVSTITMHDRQLLVPSPCWIIID
jgi:hypothetical protein